MTLLYCTGCFPVEHAVRNGLGGVRTYAKHQHLRRILCNRCERISQPRAFSVGKWRSRCMQLASTSRFLHWFGCSCSEVQVPGSDLGQKGQKMACSYQLPWRAAPCGQVSLKHIPWYLVGKSGTQIDYCLSRCSSYAQGWIDELVLHMVPGIVLGSPVMILNPSWLVASQGASPKSVSLAHN
jgi:hypothetical protein